MSKQLILQAIYSKTCIKQPVKGVTKSDYLNEVGALIMSFLELMVNLGSIQKDCKRQVTA
jgi:hypothetical protein